MNRRFTPSRRPAIYSNPSQQTGISMIEVLVTVVITAITFLGLARLHMIGLQGTSDASSRLQASLVASSMAERIHLNRPRSDADAGRYSAVDSNLLNCELDRPAPYCLSYIDETDTAIAGEVCDADQLGLFDQYLFACGSGRGHSGIGVNDLPEGRGQVVCLDSDPSDGVPCTLGSTHRIVVSWLGQDINGAIAQQNLIMAVVP